MNLLKLVFKIPIILLLFFLYLPIFVCYTLIMLTLLIILCLMGFIFVLYNRFIMDNKNDFINEVIEVFKISYSCVIFLYINFYDEFNLT